MANPSQRFKKAPSVIAPSGSRGSSGSIMGGATARIGSVENFDTFNTARGPDYSVSQALQSIAGTIVNTTQYFENRAETEKQTNFKNAGSELDAEAASFFSEVSGQLDSAVTSRDYIWQDGNTPLRNAVQAKFSEDSDFWSSNKSYAALPDELRGQLRERLTSKYTTLASETDNKLRQKGVTINKTHWANKALSILGHRRFVLNEDGTLGTPSEDGESSGPTGIGLVANEVAKTWATSPETAQSKIDKLFADVIETNVYGATISVDGLSPEEIAKQGHTFLRVFDAAVDEFRDPDGVPLLSASNVGAKRRALDSWLTDRAEGQATAAAKQAAIQNTAQLSLARDNYDEVGKGGKLNENFIAAGRTVLALLEQKKTLSGQKAGSWTGADQAAYDDVALELQASAEVLAEQHRLSLVAAQVPKIPGGLGRPTAVDHFASIAISVREQLDNPNLPTEQQVLLRKKLSIVNSLIGSGGDSQLNKFIPRDIFTSDPTFPNLMRVGKELAGLGTNYLPQSSDERAAAVHLVSSVQVNPEQLDTVEASSFDRITAGLINSSESVSERAALLFGVKVDKAVDSLKPLNGKTELSIAGDYSNLAMRLNPNGAANEKIRNTIGAIEALRFRELYTQDSAFQRDFDMLDEKAGVLEESVLKPIQARLKDKLTDAVLSSVNRRRVQVGTGSNSRYEFVSNLETAGYSSDYLGAFINHGGSLAPSVMFPSAVLDKIDEGVDAVYLNASLYMGDNYSGFAEQMNEKTDELIEVIQSATWSGRSGSLKRDLLDRLQAAKNAKRPFRIVMDEVMTFMEDTQQNTSLITDKFGRLVFQTKSEGGSSLSTSRQFTMEALHHVADENFLSTVKDEIHGWASLWSIGEDTPEALGLIDPPFRQDNPFAFSSNTLDSGEPWAASEPKDGSFGSTIRSALRMGDSAWLGGHMVAGAARRIEKGPFVGIRVESKLSDTWDTSSNTARNHASESAEGRDAAHMVSRWTSSIFDAYTAEQLDAGSNIAPASSHMNRYLQEALEGPIRGQLKAFLSDNANALDGYTVRMTVGTANKDIPAYGDKWFMDKIRMQRTITGMAVDLIILDAEGNPVPNGTWSYDIGDKATLELYGKIGPR